MKRSLFALPAAFFLTVLSPETQEPNGLIYLAYRGAVLPVAGVLTLGVGLVRGGWRGLPKFNNPLG